MHSFPSHQTVAAPATILRILQTRSKLSTRQRLLQSIELNCVTSHIATGCVFLGHQTHQDNVEESSLPNRTLEIKRLCQ
ncbi:hypothetical protein TcWFU_003710 [Taenia crassiceps]|uniref:Uncharacterized protein n=1 Tax=Taenia crassiceps TaxID=6207 RepID=A0ABR4Q863_9CEST